MDKITKSIDAERSLEDKIINIEINETLFEIYDFTIIHERKVAIHDLLQDNQITLRRFKGPYHLEVTRTESRLIFKIFNPNQKGAENFQFPLSRLQRQLTKYRSICDSYFAAISNASIDKIETIDMARRAVHNEISEQIRDHIADGATMNFDSARKFFTLMVSLFSAPRLDENTTLR